MLKWSLSYIRRYIVWNARNMVPIERFAWSVATYRSPLVPTNLTSTIRLGNQPPRLSGSAMERPSSWSILATCSCRGLRPCLGCIPIDMSDFGSEISGGGGNVHREDEIFRTSVHSIFILTESWLGGSSRNGNRSGPIVEKTNCSEPLRISNPFRRILRAVWGSRCSDRGLHKMVVAASRSSLGGSYSLQKKRYASSVTV